MRLRARLLFGPLAAAILAIGIIGLALLIPGYSHARQTSEIGEVGSPVRVPFAIMLCGVSICILVFAFAVRDVSRAVRRLVRLDRPAGDSPCAIGHRI